MKDKKPKIKDYKQALELLGDIIARHKRKLPLEMIEELRELEDK